MIGGFRQMERVFKRARSICLNMAIWAGASKKLVLFRSFKGEQSFFWWTQDEIAEKPMQYETVEKNDAGRVAPIRACVLNQIDRLKSKFEAM